MYRMQNNEGSVFLHKLKNHNQNSLEISLQKFHEANLVKPIKMFFKIYFTSV